MQIVMFTLADADRREAVLSRIGEMFAEAKVEPLFPDSAQADLEADYLIAFEPERDLEAATQALRGVPGVSRVSVPAPRKLITGSR
jgi:hypothetical protein